MAIPQDDSTDLSSIPQVSFPRKRKGRRGREVFDNISLPLCAFHLRAPLLERIWPTSPRILLFDSHHSYLPIHHAAFNRLNLLRVKIHSPYPFIAILGYLHSTTIATGTTTSTLSLLLRSLVDTLHILHIFGGIGASLCPFRAANH